MPSDRPRRRSMGFLEREDGTWACYLVTFQEPGGGWRGYFTFRHGGASSEEDEIHTAHIFIEDVEGEIDRKARGLGQPLLAGLLASALHTREREQREAPALRNWFRETLRRNAGRVDAEWSGSGASDRSLAELRSLYDSYRIDQVVHLITLLSPEDFHEAVETILDGRTFDFSARDRLQFAMMVVDHLERLLPLPPFERWAEDYLAHAEVYRTYAHHLHREGLEASPDPGEDASPATG